MDKESFNKQLLHFLDNAPTPYHAIEQMKVMLQEGGFIELDEREDWKLQSDGRYFTCRNNSSIIAFSYPGRAGGYTFLGAHSDSPNLKIKPNPLIKRAGVVQLGVEPYGGVLLNPWFDRDLSIAGKISYLNRENELKESLIDIKEPIATISSLAIHLDKEANKNRSINAQSDILPILTCSEDFDFETFIMGHIDQEGELLSHNLSLYDTQKASYIGTNREFIASARLDNLLSCFVNTQAIIESVDKPMVMVCSDHEEVGSESTSGASGPFLENVLRRWYDDEQHFVQMVRSSLLISADNAHALHPNFMAKHDDNHAPLINRGAVIKINANQRYATNVDTIALIKLAAKRAGVNLQSFVTRSDMGCGSTIGPITATRLGIETIDIGLPTYAMHSIRELAGSDDAYGLFKLLCEVEVV